MHTKYQHGGDIYSNKVSIDYSANINPLGLPQGVKEELAPLYRRASLLRLPGQPVQGSGKGIS